MIQSFEQILKLNKQLGSWKNTWFYYKLGQSYQKLGKHNKAQKIYKEGFQHFPEFWTIPWWQATCALLQNDTTSANHYINQYKSAYIKGRGVGNYEPILIAEVGRIYNEAGQLKKAEELYRHSLEEVRLNQGYNIDTALQGNRLISVYGILGSFLIDNDINVEEGMEYIHKALDLSKESKRPDPPGILSGLGWGYYKQGKYIEALQALKQAKEGTTLYNHTIHQRIQEVEQALASQN
jgi:tetratricopeptide (TPR) repeat protein